MSDNICDNGLDEYRETYNVGDDYQEAEGDCVEGEYYVDQEDDTVLNKEEYDDRYDRHEDESVELYDGDHADIVFSNEQDEPNTNDLEEVVDEENDKVSQDSEKGEGDGDTEQNIEADKKDVKVECTMTEEEKLEQYKILDGYQRQIDEEQYTLRKLRSIIGNLSDDIERLRKKIANYTKDAEDRKAMEAMEKLKGIKADRERAVEERHISTDALADVKSQRAALVEELTEKGLIINPKLTYLIEDKELQALFKNIRSILKHNSFSTLKLTLAELDGIILSVEKLCDDIDSFLISKTVKPRDLNKLNTKERRVTVLYDKLLKWRCYKVEDPDTRPTDYESFMYDPEDMFSDDEDTREEKLDKRELPKREMRAVRGGSSDKSPDKRPRSPIRPPSPSPRQSPPARPSPPSRPARRAVRGGTPDGEERPPVRETQIRKRKAETTSSEYSHKRRQASPKRPIRRSSPIRRDRPSPGKLERSKYSPVPETRRPAPSPRYSDLPSRPSTASRSRPTLLRTPPQRANTSNLHRTRSQSPVYRPRKENFQISVRNETYRSRSPVQDRRSPPPPSAPRHNIRPKTFIRGGRARGGGSYFNNNNRRNTYRR